MNEVSDGFISLLGGMQGGINPLLLGPTMYARGINVSSREGLVRTRAGFTSLGAIPAAGTFQGAARWSLNSGDRIVVAVSGRLLTFNLESETWTDLGVQMSTTAETVYLEQADRWIIAQDGSSTPKAIEEVAGVDQMYSGSNPDGVKHVPGTISKYVFGRVHFVPTLLPTQTPSLPDDAVEADYNETPISSALSGRTVFVSSDVRDNFDPQWILRMSEHRILSQGGGLAMPQELGFITGMSAFRNAATGTGTGPLILFAREGVCAFDVSVPRTAWKSQQLSQVLFFGSGTRSPFAIVPVNDDIVFLDAEGQLRTIRFTTSKTAGGSGSLSNTPMSTEVTPFLEASDRSLLPHASASYAYNRLLFTVAGEEGPQFKGVVSMDTDPTFGVSETSNALFDGMWTGFTFLRLLHARYQDGLRHFAVVRNGAALALVWYDDSALVDPNGTRIMSQLWTKFYEFGDAALLTKRLQHVDVWLSDVQTQTEFEVLFRPSGYPNWLSLGSKVLNVIGTLPQARRRLRFGVDTDNTGCNPVTQEALHSATEFQFALRWTGACTVAKFQVVAQKLADAPPECAEDNPDNNDMASAPGETLDDFEYEVTL